MNTTERVQLLRAMETVARAVNDETVFDVWLTYGVADGDIKDGTTDEELESYTEDASFSEIMDLFMSLMTSAHKSGGLYCDGVQSSEYPF